jgi:hypothetical protein
MIYHTMEYRLITIIITEPISLYIYIEYRTVAQQQII